MKNLGTVFLLVVYTSLLAHAAEEVTWIESRTPWTVERNFFSVPKSGTIYTAQDNIRDFEMTGYFRWNQLLSDVGIFGIFFRCNPLIWNARFQVCVYTQRRYIAISDCSKRAKISPLVPFCPPQRKWIPLKLIVKGNKAVAYIGGQKVEAKLEPNLERGAIALHSNGLAVDFRLTKLRVMK